ncbi:MAG: hypothetical protein M1274_05425 [Actinobacteria bacterium]|nr:hypothetical protein [Actinomycetota bacterium]
MNESTDELIEKIGRESQFRAETMERLLSAADSSKVFGLPVVSGQLTVITAAEIGAGGGFGSGMGFGLPPRHQGIPGQEDVGPSAGGAEQPSAGAGGGGGGGGGSMGRPVAVITVTPDEVRIKPVFDLTKITLTALAAMVSLAVLTIKLSRKR